MNGATFSLLSNNNIISQTNTATGDGIFGQDNSAKVAQTTEHKITVMSQHSFLHPVPMLVITFFSSPHKQTQFGHGNFNQANNAKVDTNSEISKINVIDGC